MHHNMHLYLSFNDIRDASLLNPEERLTKAERHVRCRVLAEPSHVHENGEDACLATIRWMPHLYLGIGKANKDNGCRDWRCVISAELSISPHELIVGEHIKDVELLNALNQLHARSVAL